MLLANFKIIPDPGSIRSGAGNKVLFLESHLRDGIQRTMDNSRGLIPRVASGRGPCPSGTAQT